MLCRGIMRLPNRGGGDQTGGIWRQHYNLSTCQCLLFGKAQGSLRMAYQIMSNGDHGIVVVVDLPVLPLGLKQLCIAATRAARRLWFCKAGEPLDPDVP